MSPPSIHRSRGHFVMVRNPDDMVCGHYGMACTHYGMVFNPNGMVGNPNEMACIHYGMVLNPIDMVCNHYDMVYPPNGMVRDHNGGKPILYPFPSHFIRHSSGTLGSYVAFSETNTY